MTESERCPYCGEIMENGYLIGARGIYWWPSEKPFPSSWAFFGESIVPSANIRWVRGPGPNLPANRCKKCKIILIRAPEMKIETKKPETSKELYEQLLNKYNMLYGSGKQALENQIKSLMKKGLSREEAIRILAEKE